MNSDIAIATEGLGKCFRLGLTHSGSLRELVNGTITRACRRKSKDDQSKSPFWAVRDVSFKLKRGEVLGVIGRNGAGKSTMLKLLSRITPPTEGSFSMRGRMASLLEVGTGFHPELTGRENIFLNGTILGMRRSEVLDHLNDIVDFSGVSKFIDTPVKRYSSGMKVRLGFAVAAHLQPEILIIDEVLAVGDVEFQNRCLGKMDDVARSGRTVLFVSHNLGSVVRLCTKGMFLDAGTIKLWGDVRQAVDAYLACGMEHGGYYAPANVGEEKTPHLRSVRVSQPDLPQDGNLRHDQPINCDFELWVPSRFVGGNSQQLDFSIAVFDAMQKKLFDSRLRVSDPRKHKKIVREEPLRLRMQIPARFLMPGRYSFAIGLLEGNALGDWHRHVCPFEVVDVGKDAYLQAFEGATNPGVVFDPCQWFESDGSPRESMMQTTSV